MAKIPAINPAFIESLLIYQGGVFEIGKEMCKTCAYRTPSSLDEDEMTLDYYKEVPLPHPCHEKAHKQACFGAVKAFERLGLGFANEKQP